MAPMDAIWLFSVYMQPLSATLWLPTYPLPSHPIGVLVVLAMPVKELSKNGGQFG